MSKLLEVKNLKKDFYSLDGEVNAIKDISFTLNEKEFISILGPSGCGKSTILNILSGLDFKTDGEINLIRDDITFGYMLQNDALLPWLNILDNATLGLKIKKINNDENINYTISLLNKYGLEDFLDKYPDQLSGGMKQRVA